MQRNLSVDLYYVILLISHNLSNLRGNYEEENKNQGFSENVTFSYIFLNYSMVI